MDEGSATTQKHGLVQPASAVRNKLFSCGSPDSGKSPMSELTLSLGLSKVKDTRRRLSLRGDDHLPTPEGSSPHMIANSPLLECPDIDSWSSPFMDQIRSKKTDQLRKCAGRSVSSPLLCRKPLAPLTLFDSNHKTSSPFTSPKKPSPPLSCGSHLLHLEEKHSDLSMCEMGDNVPDLPNQEDYTARQKVYRHHSASTLSMESEMEVLPCDGEENGDDRFFGDSLLQGVEQNNDCPSSFLGLIAAPILHNAPPCSSSDDEVDKENKRPPQNVNNSGHVFQKPTTIPFKKRSLSCSVKRESPATDGSPRRCNPKKQKKCMRSNSFYDGNPALRPIQPLLPIDKQTTDKNNSPRLQRSQSFDHKSRNFDITLFDMDDKSLIGDKSKKFLLPLHPSKHPDLKGISPATLVDVMNGLYKDIVEFIIVDSRYPYEYEGGHIKGGLNIHEKNGMIDYFLKTPRNPPPEGKRRVIIFHCEFSSKRGPAMCRFLRNKDRDIHQHVYPNLYYPEMYLLEGGYKEFYEKHKEYCEPQGYREMIDPSYSQELRLFSKRSKSWSEDTKSCNLRTRSRNIRC